MTEINVSVFANPEEATRWFERIQALLERDRRKIRRKQQIRAVCKNLFFAVAIYGVIRILTVDLVTVQPITDIPVVGIDCYKK